MDTTKDKIDTVIEKFRALADVHNIPKDFSKHVGEIVKKMLISIDNKDSLKNINYALHNLYISDINTIFDIMFEYYYKLNDFSESDAMGNIQLYNVHMHNIPSNYNIFFATVALERLSANGKNTYNLLNCITHSIGSVGDIEEFDHDTQEYIKDQFNKQFFVQKNLRNPLNGPKLSFGKTRTYEDILNNLTKMMPRKFK
jgi:hypothetical protein